MLLVMPQDMAFNPERSSLFKWIAFFIEAFHRSHALRGNGFASLCNGYTINSVRNHLRRGASMGL